MRKSFVALAAGALLVLPAVSASAQYPPLAPTCEISDLTVTPGQVVTLSGDNWLPNDSVDFTFDQDNPTVIVPLGSAPTNGAGSFQSDVTIPGGAHEGPFSIFVTGNDATGEPVSCDPAISGTVFTDGDGGNGNGGDDDDGGGLAFTGFAMWIFLAIALGLLAAGAAMVLASRDRSTRGPEEAERQELVRRSRLAFFAAGGALVAVVAVVALLPRILGQDFSIRDSITPLTLLIAAVAAVGVFLVLRRPTRPSAR